MTPKIAIQPDEVVHCNGEHPSCSARRRQTLDVFDNEAFDLVFVRSRHI